jgi:hypothetical protein
MRVLLEARIAAVAVMLCVACKSAPSAGTPVNTPPEQPLAEHVTATQVVAPPARCEFQASWLDASALPTDVGSDDCSFHQFMWQSFAFLAQAADGGTRFESWMPTYGIFVDKPSDQPTAWGKLPPDPCTPSKPLRVFSQITKQAGVHQPLIDHSGNKVYYGIALNKTAYDWVTGCDLYRFGCAAQLADQQAGIDLIKNYPKLAFPNGSIELKTAWKVLTDDEIKLKTFYSVSGEIRPDEKSPHACKTVTLGLVGMHIVSKTPNHPEFVWATFEHKNNAPDCSALAAQAPLPGGWTFFDKAAYDSCKLQRCTNTYVENTPALVCREHPYGDSNLGHYPDGNDCKLNPNQPICQPAIKAALTSNTAAIKAINTSATAVIAQSATYNKVWANYELVGNLWSQDGIVPPITQAQAGSLSAANSVMETFVQNGQAGVINPSNCLTCHNMVSTDGTTDLPAAGLSHIFRDVHASSGGCKSGKLPTACVVN